MTPLPSPQLPDWIFNLPAETAANMGPIRANDFKPQLTAELMNFKAQITQTFFSIDWLSVEQWAKSIAFVIIVLALALLIMLVFKIRELNQVSALIYGPRKSISQLPKVAASMSAVPVNLPTGTGPSSVASQVTNDRWQSIVAEANSYNESAWKLAVIEADKYVDDALKRNGFSGETMGERLMLIKPGDLVNLQSLWDAHKLRNLLVHDANFQLKHSQALAAVNAFESVLRELGDIS